MEEEVMKPVFTEDGREVQWCLPSSGFHLYIGKEVEATSQANQQTARIIRTCDRGALQQKPLDPKRHRWLSLIRRLSCLHYGWQRTCMGEWLSSLVADSDHYQLINMQVAGRSTNS